MERDEINSLFDDFNKNYIAKNLSEKVKLTFDFFDHDYVIADLCVDGYTYKSFCYEELLGYDNSLISYTYANTYEELFRKWLAIPLIERDSYTGQELIEALKKYLSSDYPDGINLNNPLCLMLYIIDERTDIDKLDVSIIQHKWLHDILELRLTGTVSEDFYNRKPVVLDFANCKDEREIYREIRTKMKFFFYYGDGLDALWDILTGMYFYGDDFTIKRKRIYRYEEYGRMTDRTHRIDKICELFKEASESIYSDITVKIEYID
jgi:RNAse (barnase) inhibitor barstar